MDYSQYAVSGTAKDKNDLLLAFANILLLQANDGTFCNRGHFGPR